MANRKKEVYKPKPMTEGKRNIIQGLLQEYDIETAEDIQAALRDLLGGTDQSLSRSHGLVIAEHPVVYINIYEDDLRDFIIVDERKIALGIERNIELAVVKIPADRPLIISLIVRHD